MNRRRITTAHYIGCLGLWTLASTGLVVAVGLLSKRPVFRAVVLMGSGVVLLWIVLCGALMVAWRDRVRELVLRIRLDWRVKFVLFCTLLALLEEAITTTLSNCAPLFGVRVGQAYITASANYLDVVSLHSVVVFVPMFIGWAWMLSRWDFHPRTVFILFGLTGTTAEMSFGGVGHITEIGFWTFVYGLMIWLPAYCLPANRPVRRPRWYQYPLAVILPTLFSIPSAIVIHFIHPIKIHFPPLAG